MPPLVGLVGRNSYFVNSYKIGPCMGDSCFPSVECHNVGNGSFVCESCPDGFEGDGKSCTDIDEVMRYIGLKKYYTTKQLLYETLYIQLTA